MANADIEPSRPDAEIDPTDPWAREAQTFPRLSEEMAGRVARYGREEQLAPHTVVFQRGDRGRDFVLILEGTIEVFERDDDDTVRVLRSQLAREFTGELDLFNDRAILVSGRAGEEIYLTFRNNGGSGLFYKKDRLYLQFRKGRLAGWKGDWGHNWMWQ